MSLKKRFIILILGTVLIPNIIIFAVVGLSFGGFRNIQALHLQMNMLHSLNTMLEEHVEKEELYRYLDTLPPEVDFYIVDGEWTGGNDLKETLKKDRQLQVFAFSFDDGTDAFLFIHFPVFEHFFLVRNTPSRIIALLSLLSVLTILSLLIIRSINGSLKKIEEATRRVAEGNYDFKLPVKGNDSIASLSRSFNTMIEKVREEYSRRSRFFMGVSHDLKTPLASISGYADAILEGYAEEKEVLNKYARIIKDKSQILLDRIFHLIQFVKLETGDWKTSFKEVSLKKFLSGLLDVASVDAELYSYTFKSTLNFPDDLKIIMDEELVRRSFDNIIHNAFRYAYKETEISLHACIEDKNIVISITNRGKGIPHEDIKYIFEPFYRGSATRNEDGFGLGLANVASVIKSHGWRIDVDSAPDGETTFKILIPLK